MHFAASAITFLTVYSNIAAKCQKPVCDIAGLGEKKESDI